MGFPRAEPAPPARRLYRKRISALLRRAASSRVALCVAPPGYGKTLAAEHFLRRARVPVARIALDENCMGLLDFARLLAADLSRLLSRRELVFSAIYDRVALSANPENDLVRWLKAQVGDNAVLVAIDGVDFIANDPAIARYLDAMIRELPQVRWCLLARSTGILPVPNWMADGLLDMPIHAGHLTFTRDEVADLALLYGVTESGWEGQAYRSCAGWPVAADLALRCGEAVVAAADDVRNPLPAYAKILERSYAQFESRQRDFLLDTAILDRLDANVLRALGWRDGIALLRSLQDDAPHFVQGSHGQYAYHDLARTFLIARLRERAPQAFDAAVRRCGDALERCGHVASALRLYARNRLSDRIAQLLESHGFALAETEDAEVVTAALKALPEDRNAPAPVSMAIRASFESRVGRYDISEAWYTHAIRQAEGATREAILYRYACDLMRRRRDDCIPVLEELAASTTDAEMSVNARSALAEAYIQGERVEDARRVMHESVRALSGIEKAEVLVRTLGRAAYVFLYSDDLDAAEGFGRKAAALAAPAGQYVVAVGALSVLYSVACERGDVEAALQHLRLLGEYSAYTGNLDFQLYALSGAYQLYAEMYDVENLRRCDTALRSFDLHYDTSSALEGLLPARALQSAWSGDFDRAYLLLAPSASKQHGADFKAHRHGESALYAGAAGRLDDARTHLDAASALPHITGGTEMGTQARIWLGLAHSMLGEAEAAERYFRAAFEDTPRFHRLGRLLEAARAIHARWKGEPNHAVLLQTMRDLRGARMAGYAQMLGRVPTPRSARSRLTA